MSSTNCLHKPIREEKISTTNKVVLTHRLRSASESSVMRSKKPRNDEAENEQERSLQVAVDVGHGVTLLEDLSFESDEEQLLAPTSQPNKKTPSFLLACNRCEVSPNNLNTNRSGV